MIDRSRTATVLVVLFVSLLSLSAIAMPASAARNTTVDYEVTVTEDGEVEAVDISMAADNQTYRQWEMGASFQGHDSFAEFLGKSLVESEPGLNNYTAEEKNLADGREAHVRVTDVNVSQSENMSVTAEDGTVRWESTNIGNISDDEQIDEITYTVDMPGEITDSNAMSVSDGKAVWKLHEENRSELYAETSVDGSSESLPGFGVGAALTALVGTALLARRRD